MAFSLTHTIRFHQTDAAGVMYFAQGLILCHSTYEASLQAAAVDLGRFFGGGELACPIMHTAMDYHRPLRCGDQVTVHLTPARLDQSSFELSYRLCGPGSAQVMAEAITRHVCIHSQQRRRLALPSELEVWLDRWSQ